MATNKTAPGRPIPFFYPSLLGWNLGNASQIDVSFYSVLVAAESCNFSDLLLRGTSQVYPCTHHDSIFMHMQSKYMHSEFAN